MCEELRPMLSACDFIMGSADQLSAALDYLNVSWQGRWPEDLLITIAAIDNMYPSKDIAHFPEHMQNAIKV